MSRKNLDVSAMINVLASAAAEALSQMGVGAENGDGADLARLVDALEELQDEHVDALEAAAEYAAERVGLEFSADADLLSAAQREGAVL